MKWDEDSDPEDLDEDDKDAFEGLRKVLIQCTLIPSGYGR